ncbi:MAG: dienelactone hydrolase family protein [Candidatus Sumerlaeaceae bacterium]
MSFAENIGPPDSDDESLRQFTSMVPTPGGRAITVEVLEPPDALLHPAVIVLHGADGPVRKAEEYLEVCRLLALNGFVALRPHYFDSGPPPAPGYEHLGNPLAHAAWLQAVASTADYAQQLPSVLDSPIGLMGFSLGSYLALAAAAFQQRYGAVAEFFGGMPEMISGIVERMPPTLILHGGADMIVPVEEAYKLQRLYENKGFEHEIHVYPGEAHNFTVNSRQMANARALHFLKAHLKRP